MSFRESPANLTPPCIRPNRYALSSNMIQFSNITITICCKFNKIIDKIKRKSRYYLPPPMNFSKTERKQFGIRRLHQFQILRLDIGGSNSEHTWQFDDNTAGTFDSDDSALNSLERSFHYTDLLPLTELGGDFLEV